MNPREVVVRCHPGRRAELLKKNGNPATVTDEDGNVYDLGTNILPVPGPMVLNPTGTHLYVMNSADDNIRVFEIDCSDGDLSVRQTLTGIDRPPQAVFHPSARYLYVTMQNEASVYRFRVRDDGNLDNAVDFQTSSPVQTKAIEIDGTGTSLYGAESDKIAQFELDASGRPSFVDTISVPGLGGYQRTITIN